MTDTFDIPILPLLLYGIILIFPLLIFRYLGLKKSRSLFIAIFRMIVQLSFVALYLEYIFKLNSPIVNLLWVLMMIAVANASVLNQAGLKLIRMFFYTFGAFLFSTLLTIAPLFILFEPGVLISPRYLIPLGGMILGNILRVNIVSLERFYHAIRTRGDEFIFYIQMGASKWEALKPFLKESVNSAISPYLATIATIGLVSLPGMMTGQILGGSSPAVAIKYQIMIMISIFVTAAISTFLGVLLSTYGTFDGYLRLKTEVFRKTDS